jgi:hypothetical protein
MIGLSIAVKMTMSRAPPVRYGLKQLRKIDQS